MTDHPMTTKATWLSLADRCEKATGPDRRLDIDILVATDKDIREVVQQDDGLVYAKTRHGTQQLGQIERGRFFSNSLHSRSPYPYFTASLDAITGLIERELGAFDFESCFLNDKFFSDITIWTSETSWSNWQAESKTRITGICAAFCRAQAERASDD